MIPYGRQSIIEADIAAVTDVLKSDFLTQGPQVPKFEASVLKACTAKYAVAVNSATSALHIACLALELGLGDVLWTSPITFVASANCALYCSATVDFVDIDPTTFNMCPEALAIKLQDAERAGNLPKAIVVVHMCGQSADMETIAPLARKYGIAIIEDASHAIGGYYKGQAVGSCLHSDITVFSFHPVKIITTAEGGMAVTNSQELASRMALLRSHGITRDPAQMSKVSEGPWYYEQTLLGWNYRMTDLQAALGISQISRLEENVKTRQILAKRYDEELENLPIVLPWRRPDSVSALHLYVIQLKTPSKRGEVFEGLKQCGLGVNVHYIPVHLQPFYRAMGFKNGDFPVAESYYESAITIPLFASMTLLQQDEVISALRAAAWV